MSRLWAAAVVVRLAVREGADDRDAVGDHRRAHEVVREVNAGDRRRPCPNVAAVLDRRVGLGVEGLLVRQPAAEEDVDDGLGPRLVRRGIVVDGPRAQELGEGESGERARLEEAAPGEAVSGRGHGTVSCLERTRLRGSRGVGKVRIRRAPLRSRSWRSSDR